MENRFSYFNLKGKKKAIQGLLLAFGLFATACSPEKDTKNTLFVILDSKPGALDPRKAVDANGMRLSALLFKGLVKLSGQGEAEPDLALKWELKALNYIFHLRPGLRFANGRAVEKEDILFSFEEFLKRSSPFYSAFKNIQSVEVFVRNLKPESYLNGEEINLKKIEKAEKPENKIKGGKELIEKTQSSKNKNTGRKQFIVKISMRSFQAPFLNSDLPVIKILPKKEILESPKEFQKKPFGVGDFTVAKNNFREILLKRAEPSNSLPRYISFQIIRDSVTRTQKMLSKEADIAPSVIPLQKIPQFERQKDSFSIHSKPGLSTVYLLINLKNKLLQNKNLRKAISLAINRREIIKYKLKGYALPARSFINPENYFFNKKIEPPSFNLHEAKRLIENLGLKGAKLKLSASNNRDTLNKARVLISQINQAGLKAYLETSEWGSFYKDVSQGAYELALMKWVGVTDPDIYRTAFHSENLAPKGRNRSFYINKNIDKLLVQGRRERDKEERKKIYDQVQSIISKDFVVIPLWHDMEVSAAKSSLKNYRLRLNGDFLSLPLIYKIK